MSSQINLTISETQFTNIKLKLRPKYNDYSERQYCGFLKNV